MEDNDDDHQFTPLSVILRLLSLHPPRGTLWRSFPDLIFDSSRLEELYIV
jgi:hypothetical protein